MNKKQFSTINMVKMKTNIFSYGSTHFNFNEHIFSLDKQNLSLGILKALDENKNIDEFILNVKFLQHIELYTLNNPYVPPTTAEVYDFSLHSKNPINKYELDDEDKFYSHIMTFINYTSIENQFKSIYWLVKIFSENNLSYEKENKPPSFKFSFNRKNIDLFLKDAYGKDFSILRKEKLENLIPLANTNIIYKKNKI